MLERPNRHAWKACDLHGSVGSNPTLSAREYLRAVRKKGKEALCSKLDKPAKLGVAMDFQKAIGAYVLSKTGHGWDIFWDYRFQLKSHGVSPLADDQHLETAVQLSAYLASFGMYRGSTRLSSLSAHGLADVIGSCREALEAVEHIHLESLREVDREIVVRLFSTLGSSLRERDVSSSVTMVTKMTLALWGQVPAFDSFARRTIYQLGIGTKSRQFPNSYNQAFDAMLKLRSEYENSWNRLENLEHTLNRTRPSETAPVPVARLIDMGLWWLGR